MEGTPEFWEKMRQEAHERREAKKLSELGLSQDLQDYQDFFSPKSY